MERKNWVQPTRKGKCAIVPLSSSFSCSINKIKSVQNKFPRWTSKCIIFFSPPQIFFPFPKFVICWLHIGERKPFVSKQLFWWRSKNHNKTPPNSEKKMIWLNAKSSRQTKVVWFNAMFFVTQRNFFFSTLALFEWLNWWRKNVLSCRQDSRFRRLPFFAKVAFSVEKKRIEGKSCFCVLCNRAI